MTVFLLDEGCLDPYFEDHTIAVYSTREKAQIFIDSCDSYRRSEYKINEIELDKDPTI